MLHASLPNIIYYHYYRFCDCDTSGENLKNKNYVLAKLKKNFVSVIHGFFWKNFCGLDQLWFGSIFLDVSISGFFLKYFCGLDQLWFGSFFLDFSISGFFLKNFCGLELIWVQKDFNFLPSLDFFKRNFVVWINCGLDQFSWISPFLDFF